VFEVERGASAPRRTGARRTAAQRGDGEAGAGLSIRLALTLVPESGFIFARSDEEF
jgi:hypothetical protein